MVERTPSVTKVVSSILTQSEKDFVSFGAQSIDDCLLTQLEHTLHMLLPMGRQVVRSRLAVILDIKELATPSFSGRSHSGAHIPALWLKYESRQTSEAMVCVGAARNPWTRHKIGVDVNNLGLLSYNHS